MDENCYMSENMNGKQLRKFSSEVDGDKWKYMQKS